MAKKVEQTTEQAAAELNAARDKFLKSRGVSKFKRELIASFCAMFVSITTCVTLLMLSDMLVAAAMAWGVGAFVTFFIGLCGLCIAYAASIAVFVPVYNFVERGGVGETVTFVRDRMVHGAKSVKFMFVRTPATVH